MDTSPRKMDCLETDLEDAALAQRLVRAIGKTANADCSTNKNEILTRIHKAIHDHLPSAKAEKWTIRRLRTLWDRESESVKFREMVELAKVEKANTELIEARRAHAEYIAQTAALAEFLEQSDADFHCNQIEALRRTNGPHGACVPHPVDQSG